jgi:hypothetical protein
MEEVNKRAPVRVGGTRVVGPQSFKPQPSMRGQSRSGGKRDSTHRERIVF